jgi:hypothetical protein
MYYFDLVPGKIKLLTGTFDPKAPAQLDKPPRHGTMTRMPFTETDHHEAWVYEPKEGYLGNDRAEFLVEIQGVLVRAVYIFRVTNLCTQCESGEADHLCKKSSWVISQSAFEDNDFANWYSTPSLQALLSGAKDALTGFAS